MNVCDNIPDLDIMMICKCSNWRVPGLGDKLCNGLVSSSYPDFWNYKRFSSNPLI